MIWEQVRPYACDIWNWKVQEPGTNLIAGTEKEIVLTLLPRTEGKFSGYGLIVNKLRYHRDGYKEEYLRGGGRFGQSLTAIAKLAPEAVIGEGLSVHYSGCSSLPSDVAAWLKKNGIGA